MNPPRPTPPTPAEQSPLAPGVIPRARSLPPLPPFFDKRIVRPVMLLAKPSMILTGISIRKKLIVLHTLFTVLLATVLLVAIRPALNMIVREAELQTANALLRAAVERPGDLAGERGGDSESSLGFLTAEDGGQERGLRTRLRVGSAAALGIGAQQRADAFASPGRVARVNDVDKPARAIVLVPRSATARADEPQRFASLEVTLPKARSRVRTMDYVLVGAMIAIYLLIAAALELLVLPQNLYEPIRRLLSADRAAQAGRREGELIPDASIPSDELGEIMRSRNETIRNLRSHEAALGKALADFERVAGDLKVKNHLLETAQRNLADADRLAGLGVMSAGLAHELNTPLAVLKGLAERMNAPDERALSSAESALMLRVVRRLERLSESLLDYARVRPGKAAPTALAPLVDEAVTLVRLDRDSADDRKVRIVNGVPAEIAAICDGDRIVQVLVNLVRNALDALRERGPEHGAHERVPTIEVTAERAWFQGKGWVRVAVSDNGPGIPREILPRLFEPFVSSRLDSKGTGLGLAVADGIVREHGGVIVARNREGQGESAGGAVFEFQLPLVEAEEGGSAPV